MPKFISVLLSCLLLCGCGVETKILEDIQLTRAASYDYAGDSKVRGTLAITITPPGQDNTNPINDVIVATAHTGKNLRQLAQAESPKPLLTGKLGVVIYGEDLSKRGLLRYVDGLRRDPAIGRDLYVAISEGDAGRLLRLKSPDAQSPGSYIQHVLEQNSRSNFPQSTLQTFLYHYKGEGMDPIMPMLYLKGNHVRIKGVALFKKDKYIGAYIPYSDVFVFKMLYEPFKRGIYEFHGKKNLYVTVQSVSSSVKYKITNGNTAPQAFITLKMQGRVVESGGLKIQHPDILSDLEKAVEGDIKKKAQKLITLFQKKNVDPLGLGDRTRSQTRGFSMKNWEQKYVSMPIHINVNVKITQAGITE